MRGNSRKRSRGRQLASLLALAATALVLALAATACGGGGTDSADQAPTLSSFTYKGVTLPESEVEGPSETKPFPSGYTQTETGAALAAINTTIVLDTAGDDEWGEALSALVHNNDGYKAWAVARQQVSISPQRSSAAKVVVAGYQILTFDESRATVAVFTTYPDGSHARLDRAVLWTGQDWKLDLPSDDKTPVLTSVNDFPEAMVAL